MSKTYDHGGNIFAVARQLGISPADTIDFSASINPLGISPLVREAIVSALDSLVHYPDNSCQELKQALADTHALPPERIAVANGSTEIIYQLPAMLSGRRALIIAPAFSEYANALNQHGWEVSYLPLCPHDNFSLDPELLEKTLAAGYDALYLCNPGNPSGRLYPKQVIERVYSVCKTANVFFVLDEAFMDFCEEHSAKKIITADGHGIVLRSMTKFYGIPGLRLGYALACPELIGRLDALGGPWSVNTLAQEAGLAALHDRDYSLRTIAYVAEQRRILADQLAGLPQLTVYPSCANFLLVEIDGGLTSGELQSRLLRQRLLIRDCASFCGLSNRFFRVAVRTADENRRLIAGLQEILD